MNKEIEKIKEEEYKFKCLVYGILGIISISIIWGYAIWIYIKW